MKLPVQWNPLKVFRDPYRQLHNLVLVSFRYLWMFPSVEDLSVFIFKRLFFFGLWCSVRFVYISLRAKIQNRFFSEFLWVESRTNQTFVVIDELTLDQCLEDLFKDWKMLELIILFFFWMKLIRWYIITKTMRFYILQNY